MARLTVENAKCGLSVQCEDHPEWGTWLLIPVGRFWYVSGAKEARALNEDEFHF